MQTPIYTLDIETDPFKAGRYPKPFCMGFYDGVQFVQFWGRSCIQRMHDFVYALEPGLIFMHNGGRFDAFYLMDWFADNPTRIVNSRIIRAHVGCGSGWHELRDSYAIMPFALGKFKGEVQKKEIDITKMESKNRVKHKAEILEYLERDCVVLHNLCSAYAERFGTTRDMPLTIGSTAMKEVRKIHAFDKLDKEQDANIRSRFYYGGRVECFKKGELRGAWKVYDVNSMYPDAMKSAKHPIGKPTSEGNRVTKDTCFITATGWNYNAFPTRSKGGGLAFDVGYGEFSVTIHEWIAALECGLFKPEKIKRTVDFAEQSNFAEFVDKFYQDRLDARARGDETHAMLYKFVLNSAYGKFAQNPENYKEYCFTGAGEDLRGDGWIPTRLENDIPCYTEGGNFIVWSRNTPDDNRYNVATGASITGAARAKLMRAVAVADTPIYCDTDSLVCLDLPLANIDPSELGAWKLEAECDAAYIVGKKTYALFQGEKVVKQANKGVKVTAADIQEISRGKTVLSRRDAPTFKLDGSHSFIVRRVRMT